MRLIELCRAAEIFCPAELYDVKITSVTSDSKKVRPGSLFVCLDGTKTDGNLFAEEAAANGAAAILSDKRSDLSLRAPDAHRALAFFCRKMYGEGMEKLKLVGVTGTNGKTSVTSLLRSIFSAAGYRVGTIGTLGAFCGNESLPCSAMTTPDPEELYGLLAKMAQNRVDHVFLELSSHALANKKADALFLDCGIFTNLTRDHLDFHKNEKNYFEAKKRIFGLSKLAIVNADDPHLKNIGGALTCSAQGRADFMARDVTYYGSHGCGYAFCSELYRFGLVSRIAGRFTVMNTLQAAACAVSLGVEPEFIKEGIYSLSAVDGRMERVELEGADFSVYVDYAHTPDALENLLLTAKGFAAGKIILVFGCGGERDRGKRAQMAAVASRLADKVIITSDNRRCESQAQIFEDILSGIDKSCDHILIEDRKEAIEKAVLLAESGDVVLLAGKGHEKYELVGDEKLPFDEVELVKAAYKKR